jgi:hypothetical protein
MPSLVTSFALLSEKPIEEIEINKLRADLKEECCSAVDDLGHLDDLADRYYLDAQRAYNEGYEAMTEQYLWAFRYAASLEQLQYDNLAPVVGCFSEAITFTGNLLTIWG